MSSAGVTLSGSKDFLNGNDFIERKLGSVLDRKVASSTKQVLLDRINFKEASKPDPFYTELKSHYKPLNTPLCKEQTDRNTTNGKKASGSTVNNNVKDELPSPKHNLCEQDKIKLDWKTIRKIGPGLFNLGNTCFLNSVIQVLTYTPPLANYLATQEHSRNCKSVGFCMLCELQRHIVRTFGHSQNEAIKPMAIIQKLKYIAKHLRFGHQEDSHEFLRYVIDGMLKSCLAGVSEKLDIYSKRTTIIHHVFGGYFRSQVTCERCHHISNTYDPLMEVLLDIKHAHSIQKALQRLTSVELLNGDNMYLCPRCKRKVTAKKHLTIHRPPNVMTMCLKRFDCHSLFGTKVNKDVVYQEYLNLRPFMSKNQGAPVNYKLYAVLVHSGYSCNSGHYYCFVKASNGAWYQMNDATVRQVSVKAALSQQAYLLFYIRQPPTPNKKPNHVPEQHNQSQSINGVKSWNSENISKKQNTPKIISDDTKTVSKTFIGQPVPRKPEFSMHKKSSATKLPETREKISFTLNQTPIQKKPVNSTTPEGTKHAHEPCAATPNTLISFPTAAPLSTTDKDLDEVVPVDKEEDSKDKKVSEQSKIKEEKDKVKEVDQSTTKEINEEQQPCNIHATTKWKVTPTTPIGPLPPGGHQRERTPSLSSDVSNSCSVASKTGEWAVSDRNTTELIGPRLPERQHAGWKVSTTTEDENNKDNEKEGEKKSEETKERSDKEEHQRKTKKRKHSKERHEKTKFRKADAETRLLSDDDRKASESDDTREKHHKKKKKSKKVKKAKSGSDSDSSLLPREGKRKKEHKKAKKKKKKKKRKTSSDIDVRDSDKDVKSCPEVETKKQNSIKKLVKKTNELVRNTSKVPKKKVSEFRKPLVQYSDHSSSSSGEEENTRRREDNKGSSRYSVECESHRKDDTKSWRAEGRSNSTNRNHDNRDRKKNIVDMLLAKSRGSTNYGCRVEKWDDDKVCRVEVDVRDKSHDKLSKRRRDEWDEEYDRGKTKRTKNRDNILNRTYPTHNHFQREYDRRRIRQEGWHNRSADRYYRRDR